LTHLNACPIGTAFVVLLRRQGIIPGIKVDTGTKPVAGLPDEVVTEGSTDCVTGWRSTPPWGARFAKWRAVIPIKDGLRSATCLEASAHALARYAALAQEAGLAPIVYPEVIMDGTHDLERGAEVSVLALRAVYEQLARCRVPTELAREDRPDGRTHTSYDQGGVGRMAGSGQVR